MNIIPGMSNDHISFYTPEHVIITQRQGKGTVDAKIPTFVLFAYMANFKIVTVRVSPKTRKIVKQSLALLNQELPGLCVFIETI